MSLRAPNVSLRHALLAVAVMAVWGTNFVVIHIGLQHLPPLLFAALRFAAALLPAVLFIKRPTVPWRNLAAYGLLIGVGQFGILFIAMNGQITPASPRLSCRRRSSSPWRWPPIRTANACVPSSS